MKYVYVVYGYRCHHGVPAIYGVCDSMGKAVEMVENEVRRCTHANGDDNWEPEWKPEDIRRISQNVWCAGEVYAWKIAEEELK